MTPTPTHVWLVVEPIDMRAGIDGLSQSPCDGSAYAHATHCDVLRRWQPAAGLSYFVNAKNNSGSFSGRRWMLSMTVYCRPKMPLTYSSAFGSRLMQ